MMKHEISKSATFSLLSRYYCTIFRFETVFSRQGVAAKIGEEVDETTFVHGSLCLVEKVRPLLAR